MFGIEYFLWEKLRGLDFTMRDTSLFKSSNGLCHGHSKTAEKHLKKIFSSLTFDGSERLLDIGCGKGVVLRVASGYPFEKVAGKLLDISERNPVTVIYHNPVYMELFEQKGKVTILKELYDKTNNYSTYIFRIAGSRK